MYSQSSSLFVLTGPQTVKSPKIIKLVTLLLFFINLLILSGDVHVNPGPTKLKVNSLNVQSIKGVTPTTHKMIDFCNPLEIQKPEIIVSLNFGHSNEVTHFSILLVVSEPEIT